MSSFLDVVHLRSPQEFGDFFSNLKEDTTITDIDISNAEIQDLQLFSDDRDLFMDNQPQVMDLKESSVINHV